MFSKRPMESGEVGHALEERSSIINDAITRRTLFAGRSGLEAAKKALIDYKEGRVKEMSPELWQAKKIVDSTLHPGSPALCSSTVWAAVACTGSDRCILKKTRESPSFYRFACRASFCRTWWSRLECSLRVSRYAGAF